MTAKTAEPGFAGLFTPKLVTVLREGYGLAGLRADVVAGLTVAIVALPLSMAIAIASGVSPERGLFTSIVGGFCISAFGGSRFQIGGPAGAFIVLVAATVQQHGVDGMLLATLMGGIILLAIGFLRLGTFIKYIPYPVTVGFTSGIAVIIFASQIAELLGLTLPGAEPGPLVPKLMALGAALPTVNPASLGVAILTIGLIALVRRLRPRWPAFLIAVGAAAVAAWLLDLPVATIGTRFGGIPRSLPAPHLPEISVSRVMDMLPAALSFALLGAIESLLSAVVADSMSGSRHRSNCELAAQGIANMASALFGGMCATGTIARTATNVRAGARGPVAGILHALFLLLFMLLAAPLASYFPLPALSAVLAVVCWSMAEKHAFATLTRASRGDAVVLLATFLTVVFRDLTSGILVGFGLGALLFLHRMAQAVGIESGQVSSEEDRADPSGQEPYDAALAMNPDILVYRISGAFFFGAAAAVGAALDRISAHPKVYVVDFSSVSILDSTAAATIEGFCRKARRNGAAVVITGASPPVRRMLLTHGVHQPEVAYRSTVAEAVAEARGDASAAAPSRMREPEMRPG